jgi:putative salt-induced outer membrane protein YdiY
VRAARKLTPRLEIYVQGAYRENTFAGIDHQWAGDAGVAYQFLSGDPHSLKVEAVKLSYAWLTLNEPVPGKKKTDTITSAALVAKF